MNRKSFITLYKEITQEIESILLPKNDKIEEINDSNTNKSEEKYKSLYEIKSFFREKMNDYEGENFKILLEKFEILKPKVDIHNSKVGGVGLFATEDIPIGSVITFYPGDSVLNFNTFVKGTCMISFASEDNEFRDRVIQDDPEIEKYKMVVNKYYSIIANPKNISNNSYIAHLAKDAARPLKKLGIDQKELQSNYLFNSILKCNSKMFSILDCHIALIAVKDIKQNEEIFCSYGLTYWSNVE